MTKGHAQQAITRRQTRAREKLVTELTDLTFLLILGLSAVVSLWCSSSSLLARLEPRGATAEPSISIASMFKSLGLAPAPFSCTLLREIVGMGQTLIRASSPPVTRTEFCLVKKGSQDVPFAVVRGEVESSRTSGSHLTARTTSLCEPVRIRSSFQDRECSRRSSAISPLRTRQREPKHNERDSR